MRMKKSIKNKKGFTLIELLVTIALMLSILGIAIISLINISNKKKEEAYKLVTEQIKTAAEQYFDSKEYMFEDLSEGAYGIITVGMLVNEDYLNKVTDPRTGHAISNCSQVQVKRENGIFTSRFKEYDANDKCESDYSITVSEPGAPRIELIPYKSDDTKHEKLESWNGWYNSLILGTANLGIYVEGITNGNGPIKAIYSCGEDLGNCGTRTPIVIDQAYYEDIESYNKDTDGKRSCYQVTNTSGKIAKKCTELKVDRTPPTCEISAEGQALKAMSDTNPTGEVVIGNKTDEDYNKENFDVWFTSDVNIKILSTDNLSGSKYYVIYDDNKHLEKIQNSINNNKDEYKKYLSKTYKEDTSKYGQNFYGYAEDEAGNWSSCEITVKRDTIPPQCEIKVTGEAKKRDNEIVEPYSAVAYNTKYNILNWPNIPFNPSHKGIKNFTGWFTSKVTATLTSGDSGSGVDFKTFYQKDPVDGDKALFYDLIPNRKSTLKDTKDDDTKDEAFYGYALDNAGNWSSCQVNFQKDATAPTCRVTKSPVSGKNDWYIDDPTINLSSSDGVSGVDKDTLYYWKVEDPKALIKAGKDTDTRTLNWDTNYVGYAGYVVDNAGNEVNGDCYVEARRDATPPTCNLTANGTLGNNGWYTSNVSIDISASDGGDDNKRSGMWYTTFYNPGEEGDLANNTKTPDSNTRHQTADTANSAFYGYAKDHAGNWSSCQTNVKKDTEAPKITNATLSCETSTVQNRIVLTITDNLSGFANAPFNYTHGWNSSKSKGNYHTPNSLNGNRYWHGFGYASKASNNVTINEITVYDFAGNSRKYINDPISCSYPSSSSDGAGGRYPKSPYNCPNDNPERQCTLN